MKVAISIISIVFMLFLNCKIGILWVVGLFVQLWHFTEQASLICVSWKVLAIIIGVIWLISVPEHSDMWSNIYEKATHSIEKWCQLTSFHLSLKLFVSNYTVFFELLVIYLRIFFLQDVLLIYCVVSSLRALVFDRTDTLRFFCMVKKHLILPFSWLIND